MRITDLLKKSGIALGVKVADKSEAIDKLVSLHEKCGNLKDVKAYKEGILNREELGTTAVGMEVAIPHAKSEAVKLPPSRLSQFQTVLIMTRPTVSPVSCSL